MNAGWNLLQKASVGLILARTKTLETLVPIAKPGITPQDKHYLFPIPQRKIDLNPNLKQNPGY